MSKHNNFPIPSRYKGPAAIAAMRGENGSQCCDQVRAFVKNWDGVSGGALLGPTRKGKSTAAGLCGDREARKENSETWTKWIRADHLTRIVNERNAGDTICELKQARLLIIDEIGYEPWPTMLLEVIGDRHDNQRPLIITSGLRVEEFTKRYSDATLARIAEIGNGIVVDCWGKP